MAGLPPDASNNKIATILAIVITAIWSISFLVDIFVKEYDPSPSVHALMMMVAGAVFGEGLIKSRNSFDSPRNRKENDE